MSSLDESIEQNRKLNKFRDQWRAKNPDNTTTIDNYIFDIDKVTVGRGTYGNLKVQSFGVPDERLKIGNYDSIADNVTFVIGGEHDYTRPLSFPYKAFYVSHHADVKAKGTTIVEDDCWIGMNVTILSGSKLGQGSVVAAGALVNKDIPPYAIVGGVPAKVLKYRFKPETIEKLLNIDFAKVTPEFFERYSDVLNAVDVDRDIDKLMTIFPTKA
ncbi:MAG TPA: antibiotic acetyltransferase [Lactobacillus sp.]|nr:antibiotic acetyltransferase [Lactobacillus sp.]